MFFYKIITTVRQKQADQSLELLKYNALLYRHTGQQETYVYCKDKAGNELLVVYVDNVWDRSISLCTTEC